MTKIDIVSGFLGAGKTTFIQKMLKDVLHKEKVVLIENECFSPMTKDMNVMLQELIDKMLRTGNEEGALTLKLKIRLLKRDDDFGVKRTIPEFVYDVGSEVKEKEKKSGYMASENFIEMKSGSRIYSMHPMPSRQEMMDI